MPLFTVTKGDRVLSIRAACRTCARNIAIDYIAPIESTMAWRDPVLTKVTYVSTCEKGNSGVLSDSCVDSPEGVDIFVI